MTLYMDRHDGITDWSPRAAVEAHLKDLEVQVKYDVRYVTYWIDEPAQQAFCLVEAPSAEAASAVHREAHGVVANEIIEVDHQSVEQFLGRIADTPTAKDPTSTDTVPSLRTILFSDMEESTALTQRVGDDGMMAVLRIHNTVIRDALGACSGTEVKHTGDGIMASFASASRALECAITAQKAFSSHNKQAPDQPVQVRIGLTAGEPVMEHQDLFGAAVQLAKRICDQAQPGQILVGNVVRELCIGKGFLFADSGETALRGFEDPVRLYEVSWQERRLS